MFPLEGKQRSELKWEAARLFPPACGGTKRCPAVGDKYVSPQIAIKITRARRLSDGASCSESDVAEMSHVIMSCDCTVVEESCTLPR